MSDLPDPLNATDEDLRLAFRAIGGNARYGGLLACVLAGIYAERDRQAVVLAVSKAAECQREAQ